jgi:hypothetical protein
MDINLLPQEFKPKGYVLKLSQTLKKLVIFGLVVFLITASIIAGLFVTSSIKSNSITTENSKLVSEIKALEKTEQRYVLIKDRLKRIDKIKKEPGSYDGIDTVKEIADSLPSEILLTGVDISKEAAKFSVITNNSTNISQLFTLLISQGYSSIKLDSLNYDLKSGYTLIIDISPKKI